MTRVVPRSLQGRMLALSAVATLLALVIAGWMIAAVLGRFVIEGLDRRLDAELALMASVVDRNGDVDEQRLRRSLAAFDEGPGWRWQLRAPGRTIASTDFPTVQLPEPPPPPFPDAPPHRPRELRDGKGEPLHARTLTLDTPRGPVVLTAAAPRGLLRRPIEAALAPLLAVLALLAALLGTASVVQLRLGLRPLRRLRGEVAAIRSGLAERVSADQPSELHPLAEELNALAAQNEAALAAARQSAANLAHALKTPVATLALDLRAMPAQAAQVARIDATIRHHLARARMQTGHRRPSTALAPAVSGVIDAVRRLSADRALCFETDVPDRIEVGIDAHDLDELLGNLLDNAARHARARIWLQAAHQTDDIRWVMIQIEDDGPGLPAEARERIGQAGLRLDEQQPGYGFGLAIVREMLALYGGRIRFDPSEHGGLRVEVALPAG